MNECEHAQRHAGSFWDLFKTYTEYNMIFYDKPLLVPQLGIAAAK